MHVLKKYVFFFFFFFWDYSPAYKEIPANDSTRKGKYVI